MATSTPGRHPSDADASVLDSDRGASLERLGRLDNCRLEPLA